MSVTYYLMRLLLGRRLPTTTGELRVRGLSAPVTIRRDGNGVPHVDAESELDAYYALGFCQGQDRAAQLETLWRVGRGRLAEWVGSAGLGADRMSRRIGFHASSEKQYPVLSEVVRRRLEAFAAGVTAGASAGLPHAPHEFAILGGAPSPWAGIDVLTLMKLQSFSLASNWDVELARLRILLADGPDALLAFDPLAAGEGERVRGGEGEIKTSDGLISPPLPLSVSPPHVQKLLEDIDALRQMLPAGGGSNNWFIAGSRTASGKPVLASDPHLAPSAPPPWYLAHARCPEWEAAGAQLAGTPTFSIAHNGFAAWGVTAGLTDNSDIYLEELGPDGHSAKSADGSFVPCDVRREVIRVRGAADEVIDVVVTPRGPVITPLVEDVTLVVSLRAVWLEPLPVNGYFEAVTARSFDEFRRSFAKWPVMPLNVLYADINGALGWQLIGQIPQRAAGHGLVPRPGWLPGSEWNGMVPFDAMPHRSEFREGYFATANNEPVWPSPEPWLSADYCDPYRVRSITEALAAKDSGWTVEECLALQRGVRSIPWEEVRDTVLSLTPTSPDAADGLELLEEWDGRVDSESPAACVFELFLAEMCVRTAKVKTPKAWRAALGERGGPLDDNFFVDRRIGFLVRQIREQPAGWFASWPAEMEAALGQVVLHLRTTVGPGPAYWAWGHLRQLRLDHPLFKNHPWLGPVFNLGPVPCGGDTNTISQAGAKPTNPTGYTHNMANMRTAFDLGDLAKSRFVLCGGQSGNPWSDHHADQLPLWQAGESIPIPWLQAEVIRASRATLRLLPAGEGKGGQET